ncbi:MAG: protein-disulfide reductase DsbD domain-containing protein [Acidobacteriota bacterium]
MKKIFINLAVLMVLLFTAGFATELRAQTVAGSIGNGSITRGKTVRASVVLSIPGGLHVNSAHPNSEYSVPTSVRATASGAKIGPVSYPRGKDRKFSFSENSINVYEGRTTFGFNVTVPAGYDGSSISVRVVVKYQACTEEVCYPPRTKEITLKAKVK